jgi:hypothetical protein
MKDGSKSTASLPERLLEAAQWCAGEQIHTFYSDAAYIALFREAARCLACNCCGTPDMEDHDISCPPAVMPK